MNYSVKFNGVELVSSLMFYKISRLFPVQTGLRSFLNTEGTRKGVDFNYTTYKYRTIPMPFTMLGNLEDKYDKLEKILNVDSPKPLVFESMPDRMFYAIPDGDLEIFRRRTAGRGNDHLDHS